MAHISAPHLPFRNRVHAGQLLAQALQDYAGHSDVIVLALPRGGVPVAFEVARALKAPLDLMLVRKLGTPGQEELAMGAIVSGGVRVLNDDMVRMLRISDDVIEAAARREQKELERRQKVYRGELPPPQVRDKCVILVDDGIATGATIRSAVKAVREQARGGVVPAEAMSEQDLPRVFALSESRAYGERVAAAMGTALAQHEERAFEDGECKLRPLENVRGRPVCVIQSLYGEPGLSVHDKFMRLLFFIGALKDAAASQVTAVLPYLCYARKDRKTKPRDPVATRYVACLLEAAGVVSGEAVIGEVRDKMAIIIDDLISTGGTLARGATTCRRRGATAVYAAATHGVFVGDAARVFAGSDIAHLVITDSIPPFRLDPALVRDKVTVLDTAPLFAQAIRRIHGAGSLVALLE